MKARVALARCQDYDVERVCAAVQQVLEPFGGIAAFVRPGQRVVMQVNLISARPPEDAVCTHPSVVRAVCRLVREAGGRTAVGGSAGGSAYRRTGQVLKVSGISDAVAQEGAELLNYDDLEGRDVQSGGRFLPNPHISKAVLDADVLVTLPKMKTHALTMLTGAVKNHLGTLPGPRKGELHRRFPDPEDFGEALLDIYAAAPPHLAIMDAIQGMDGDGPTAGRVRDVGLIAASADGVALDTVMAAACGLDARWIPTLVAAERRQIGASALGDIELVGVPLSIARQSVRPFAYPSTYRLLAHDWIPRWARSLFARRLGGSPRPYVIAAKCNGCRTCVISCPMNTIAVVEKKARIDQSKCISCFCCHEVCPEQGIGIRIPRMWGMMRV